MVVRWEDRDFAVYNLVVADGGAKLKPSVASGDNGNGEISRDVIGPSMAEPGRLLELDSEGCPLLRTTSHGAFGSAGKNNCTAFRSYSMADFITTLEMMEALESGSFYGPQSSQAHIVDRTNQRGEFDFNLKFDVGSHVRGTMLEAQFAGGTSGGGSSLSEALKKQLGLKLEKTTSRLRVLVIEQIVNKIPTPN
jgi:uncharacterized protein (TIGR03435 family)